VPSVLLLESGEMTPSGVLVCSIFNVGKSTEITPSGVLAVLLFGSQRSQLVVC
jgi:hypothetical protein